MIKGDENGRFTCSCGKPLTEHTKEELGKCISQITQDESGHLTCACGKPVAEHTMEDFRRCAPGWIVMDTQGEMGVDISVPTKKRLRGG